MKKSSLFKILFGIVAVLVIYLNSNFSFASDKDSINNKVLLDELVVNFIDVGQGDAIFIESSEVRMLIDAGEANMGDEVVSFIKSKGYNDIDYLIGTHPHSDHIGGLSEVINSFNIGNIYMPKAVHTSKTYENLLKLIASKDFSVKSAKSGVVVYESDEMKISFVAPNKDEYSEINNYSAVVKLDYGEVSFLFMGDAEVLSEKEIKSDVSADVIKVGHHGSDTSSGDEFVKRVNPTYAIISVGEDNIYGLPDENVVSRWESVGAKIYRTDESGDIIISTDGVNINVSVEK